MGSFVESRPAGADALRLLQEAVFAVESTDGADNVWLWAAETQSAPVPPPPPPPPPFRVTLNLAHAIEAEAPEYEPVVQAFEKEMVGDAPLVESQVLKNIEGA